MEIIENAGLSYLCRRTKMEEVLFQSFYRFRVDSRKLFEYAKYIHNFFEN